MKLAEVQPSVELSIWEKKPDDISTWEKKGDEIVPFERLCLREGKISKVPSGHPRLGLAEFLIKRFGGDISRVTRIDAIYNESLLLSLKLRRNFLYQHHRNDPQKFKKSDWKNEDEKDEVLQRFRFLDHLSNQIDFYDWNATVLV